MRKLLILALLAGCASQQAVTLMPRGPGNLKGSGIVNNVNNDLTIQIGENTYTGKIVYGSSVTNSGGFGAARTTYSTNASALLIGIAGQVRCDLGFDQFYTMGTGVCVDHRNVTYDIIVK